MHPFVVHFFHIKILCCLFVRSFDPSVVFVYRTDDIGWASPHSMHTHGLRPRIIRISSWKTKTCFFPLLAKMVNSFQYVNSFGCRMPDRIRQTANSKRQQQQPKSQHHWRAREVAYVHFIIMFVSFGCSIVAFTFHASMHAAKPFQGADNWNNNVIIHFWTAARMMETANSERTRTAATIMTSNLINRWCQHLRNLAARKSTQHSRQTTNSTHSLWPSQELMLIRLDTNAPTAHIAWKCF